MKEKTRKILEILLVILIVGLSVTIFLFRGKIENIGEVGYLGLFFVCLLANATVLLPSPSLMLAASCALIMNPFWVAVVAALGSTIGEYVGYALGTVTKDLSPKFQKLMEWITAKVHKDVFVVFLLAVLPLPIFDIAGIYSGGTKMNFLKFSIACFLGKFLKTLVYTRMYDIIEWALSVVQF